MGTAAGMVAALFPVVLLLLDRTGVAHVSPILFWLFFRMAALIVFTYRANLRRLIQGTENRFPRLMIFARLFGEKRREG